MIHSLKILNVIISGSKWFSKKGKIKSGDKELDPSASDSEDVTNLVSGHLQKLLGELQAQQQNLKDSLKLEVGQMLEQSQSQARLLPTGGKLRQKKSSSPIRNSSDKEKVMSESERETRVDQSGLISATESEKQINIERDDADAKHMTQNNGQFEVPKLNLEQNGSFQQPQTPHGHPPLSSRSTQSKKSYLQIYSEKKQIIRNKKNIFLTQEQPTVPGLVPMSSVSGLPSTRNAKNISNLTKLSNSSSRSPNRKSNYIAVESRYLKDSNASHYRSSLSKQLLGTEHAENSDAELEILLSQRGGDSTANKSPSMTDEQAAYYYANSNVSGSAMKDSATDSISRRRLNNERLTNLLKEQSARSAAMKRAELMSDKPKPFVFSSEKSSKKSRSQSLYAPPKDLSKLPENKYYAWNVVKDQQRFPLRSSNKNKSSASGSTPYRLKSFLSPDLVRISGPKGDQHVLKVRSASAKTGREADRSLSKNSSESRRTARFYQEQLEKEGFSPRVGRKRKTQDVILGKRTSGGSLMQKARSASPKYYVDAHNNSQEMNVEHVEEALDDLLSASVGVLAREGANVYNSAAETSQSFNFSHSHSSGENMTATNVRNQFGATLFSVNNDGSVRELPNSDNTNNPYLSKDSLQRFSQQKNSASTGSLRDISDSGVSPSSQRARSPKAGGASRFGDAFSVRSTVSNFSRMSSMKNWLSRSKIANAKKRSYSLSPDLRADALLGPGYDTKSKAIRGHGELLMDTVDQLKVELELAEMDREMAAVDREEYIHADLSNWKKELVEEKRRRRLLELYNSRAQYLSLQEQEFVQQELQDQVFGKRENNIRQSLQNRPSSLNKTL